MPSSPRGSAVTVVGESMRFLIAPGEEVQVAPAKPENMAAGDIALLFDARRGMGARPFVHRVTARRGNGGGAVLRTRGDASWTSDPEEGMILVGRVEAIRKKGLWRKIEGSRARRFWPILCLYSPVAAALLKIFFVTWHRAAACADRLLGLRGRVACACFGEAALIPWALRCVERLPLFLLGNVDADRPPPPGAGARFGRIDHDETWRGDVRVTGDVVVGAGARLTLTPGTRLIFDSKCCSRAPYPFGRTGREGKRWVGSEAPRLLVYGRLEMRGGEGEPIRLEGSQWGGVHVLAAGEANLGPHVEISGAGVCAWDRARLSMEACRVAGSTEGVAVRGKARAVLNKTAVSALGGPGLVVEDDSLMTSTEGRIQGGGGPALRATGGLVRVNGGELSCDDDAAVLSIGRGRAEIGNARAVSKSKSAVSVGRGGRVVLNDCRFEGAEGGAISLAAGGRLSGTRVTAVGTSAQGVSVGPGAILDLVDADVRAFSDSALTLEAGARLTALRLTAECGAGVAIKAGPDCVLELEDSSLSSGQACLVLDGATATLKNVALASRESSAAVVKGGSFSMRGGAGAALLPALSVDGGEAFLEDVRLESRQGGCVSLRGCAAVMIGCEVRASSDSALTMEAGARLTASRLTAECGAGIAIKAGPDCILEAEEGSFSSGQACLVLDGASAKLKNVALASRESSAAVVKGGSFSMRGGAVSALFSALSADGGTVSLENARLESSQGACVSLRDCAARITGCGLSSGLAYLILNGAKAFLEDVRLEARAGVDAAPDPLLALEAGARLVARRLTTERGAGVAIKAGPDCVLEAEESSLSSGETCLVLDGASAKFENVALASRESSAAVMKGGSFSMRGGTVSALFSALSADGGTARLEDVRLESRQGACVSLRGGAATMVGCGVSAGADSALTLEAGARLTASRLTAECGAGVAIKAGPDCVLESEESRLSSGEACLVLDGAAAALKNVMLASRESSAASISDGSLKMTGGEARGVHAVTSLRGRLIVSRALLTGQSKALDLEKGSASLTRVAVRSDAGDGVVLRGGTLSGEDVSIDAARGACDADEGGLILNRAKIRGGDFGVSLKGGESILNGLRVAGGRLIGIGLNGGHHRLSGISIADCAEPGLYLGAGVRVESRDVLVEGAPWLDPGELPASGGPVYRGVLAFVLATRNRLLFEGTYRAVAGASVALVSAAAHFSRALSGVIVYRGWTEGDWQAGLSDVDFHCILAPSRDEADSGGRIGSFLRFYRRLRRVLPMLGEILVCSDAEAEDYVRDGGARAEEFVRTARPLSRSIRVPERPTRGNPIASATEALHAYSRMMAVRFPGVRDSAERSRYNMRKAFLDVLRFCRCAGDGAAPAPRKAFEASLRSARGDLAALLDRDDRDGMCAAAYGLVDEACSAFLVVEAPAPSPASAESSPVGKLEESFHRELEAFSKTLGIEGAGFSLEDGQRFELILKASPEGDQIGALCRELEDLRRRHSFLRTLPLILSRSAWEFLQQSPYRHHPTAFMDCTAPDGRMSTGARGLAGFARLRRGVPPVARRLGAGHARDAAVQSLRHLDLCWREMLFSEDPRNAAYHVYSRALGLRLLLEGGVAMPFTELETVIAAARERFTDARPWLDRLDLSRVQAGTESLAAHYPFISRQLSSARLGAAGRA